MKFKPCKHKTKSNITVKVKDKKTKKWKQVTLCPTCWDKQRSELDEDETTD